MKSFYIFISVFLIYSTNIFSQKQLSHFVSEGSDTKNIVKNINGKNYLLSFYQSDEIFVYEIESEDSKNLLHQRYFQGLFENNDIKIFGEKMIFESYSGFIIYDFINDSIIDKTFDYPISYCIFKYPSESDFIVTIKMKDTSVWNSYVIDFNGNIADTLQSGIHCRKANNLIYSDYEYTEKKHTYRYHNYLNNKTDTLFTTFNCRNRFELAEDKMWYQDNEKNIIEYNYGTGEKTHFQDVVAYDSYYYYVYKFDNYLYLYNFNHSDRITHIQIFNIDTKRKVNEIDIPDTDRIERNHFYVYNNKIVIHIDDGFGAILIIDSDTKEYSLFEMYNNVDQLHIMEGGKILNFYTKWHKGYVFELIDIDSRTSKIIEGNHKIVSSRYDFIKVGNKYIGSFFNNYSYGSLFVIDTDSLVYYYANNLDQTNTGFERKSKIVELNDKLMVLADNLYQLNSDTLQKINTTDIYKGFYHKYSIQNNKVYFSKFEGSFPDQYFIVNSYDNKKIKLEMKFKTSWDILGVREYFDEGNYIYFTTPMDDFYKYSKSDSTIEKVDRLHTLILNEKNLVIKDSFIYYCNNGLKLIKNNGNPITLLQSDARFGIQFLQEFKNKLYFFTGNSIYEVKGDNLTTIFESDKPDFAPAVIYDKPLLNFIFKSSDDRVYHYNGNELHTIFDSSTNCSIRPAVGQAFIIEVYNIAGNQFYYYDCLSKELSDMSSEPFQGKRYVDVFTSKGDTILLTKSGSNPKDILYIYKVSEHFTSFELIDEFQDVGRNVKARFISFGNEGILYTGDVISLMDENLGFHPLNGIKGYYGHPEIIERNGDLYFLAIDKIAGRQLYKTTLYSHRPDNNTNNEFNYNLEIIPNPSTDFISIENLKLNDDSFYIITDISGKTITKNRFIRQSINISDLKSGVYILSILNDKKLFSGKFIKQ